MLDRYVEALHDHAEAMMRDIIRALARRRLQGDRLYRRRRRASGAARHRRHRDDCRRHDRHRLRRHGRSGRGQHQLSDLAAGIGRLLRHPLPVAAGHPELRGLSAADHRARRRRAAWSIRAILRPAARAASSATGCSTRSCRRWRRSCRSARSAARRAGPILFAGGRRASRAGRSCSTR